MGSSPPRAVVKSDDYQSMSERKKREASLPPSAFTLPTYTVLSSSPASNSTSLTRVHVPGKSTPYPGRARSMSIPPPPSPLKNMIKQEPSDEASSSIPLSTIPSSPSKSMSTRKPSVGAASQVLSSPMKSILKKYDSGVKDSTAKVLFAKDKNRDDSPLKKKHKKEKKADRKKNKLKSKSKVRF